MARLRRLPEPPGIYLAHITPGLGFRDLGFRDSGFRDLGLRDLLSPKKDPFFINIRNPVPEKYKGSLTLIQFSFFDTPFLHRMETVPGI